MFHFLISFIYYIFNVLVLFGFLFEIPISGSLTSRRASCLVAVIVLVLNRRKLYALMHNLIIKRLQKAICLLLICLFLVLISSSFVYFQDNNSSYLQPWYFVNLFLYVIVFSFFRVTRFKDAREFLLIYVTCFLIQTAVVYYAVINTAFRLLIFNLFYSGDDRFERYVENGTRIMGIALHSSTGSIICSTSIVLLTYCYLKKHIQSILYFTLSILFVSMTMFIGRTGLLVEILCFVYAVISGKNKNRAIKLFFASFAVLISIYIVLNLISVTDSGGGNYLMEWICSAFTSKGRQDTMDIIVRKLPPLSYEFIFGTSVMNGRTPDGIRFDTDSGYIMMYASLGIVGSLFYYLAHYNLYLITNIKKRAKVIYHFFWLIILISFVIEYKEPFMFKYIFSYIIMVVTLFENKELLMTGLK